MVVAVRREPSLPQLLLLRQLPSMGLGLLAGASFLLAVRTALPVAVALTTMALVDRLISGADFVVMLVPFLVLLVAGQLIDNALEPVRYVRFDGVDLSEGQWQKVALGRACMRQAPLLVLFDEPTASLDAPSEQAIFERHAALARRLGEKHGTITLIVSHRFSTVRTADLILVLADGTGRTRDPPHAGRRWRHLLRSAQATATGVRPMMRFSQ